MKPLVSICVPAYNAAVYLGQCLDSALAQAFTDFELVLVDNVSSDDTVALAQEYARRDRRIRVYQNTENIGSIRNFNRCVELAQGEWLKFLGADDWLEPTCLAHMLDARRPGVLLIVCRESLEFERGITDGEKQGYLQSFAEREMLPARFPGRRVISAEAFADLMIQEPTVNRIGGPGAIMVHSTAFARFGGLNPNLITHDDWEFCARVAVNTGLGLVPDSLASMRVHPTAKSIATYALHRYKMDVISPLIIRHDLTYAPVYTAVRAAARRCQSPINLRHQLVDFAREAQRLAHVYANHPTHPDRHALADWEEVVKQYPSLLSVSPSYYAAKCWRGVRRRLQRMRARLLARSESFAK